MTRPPQLWAPSADAVSRSQLEALRRACCAKYSLDLPDYGALHAWSIREIASFWESVWDFAEILHSVPYDQVVDDPTCMPGARWFRNARLNFAENLLRYRDGRVALIACDETGAPPRTITYADLYAQAMAVAEGLRAMGIGAGDRVAALMPNTIETVVAMLAATALGAVWTSCSPDFGIQAVLDRFRQVAPKVLIVCDSYHYKGRRIAMDSTIDAVRAELPGLRTIVRVVHGRDENATARDGEVLYSTLLRDHRGAAEQFEQLPFEHPLYIMYSSGTTGLPKAIVHGAGGTLLQHVKEHRLHTDLRREDVLFYFTTCGWMMWNWLVSGLATGATLVLYDGSPFHPAQDALWRIADELGVTVFGTSAKFLMHTQTSGVQPNRSFGLSTLRAVLSTGSTLPEESFDFVYRDIKEDVHLASISGGTDIISCFALGCPVLPVHRGELQCRGLGMAVEVFDNQGRAVADTRGELVCTAAFPSMPVGFWNDPDGAKYRRAYFERFPGVWHHGDFVSLNSATGGVKIYGRSDATLNPGGVRIGTAEIYRAIESIDAVHDSLAVGQRWNDDERVVLFVQLAEGHALDAAAQDAIRTRIRQACSPRHVPAVIAQVPEIPYTLNGKKVELAVRNILHGEPVMNRDAIANPAVLEYFAQIPELRS